MPQTAESLILTPTTKDLITAVQPSSRGEQLIDYVWPQIWREEEPVVLFDTQGRRYEFQKGERVYYPKQIEIINSGFKYKATLAAGGTGGGKTRAACWWAILWLAYLKSQGFAGVNVAVFGETLGAVIARVWKNLPKYFPEWVGKSYGGSGGMKNEFVLCDDLGGGRLTFLSSDEFDTKQKGIEYGAVIIDESTNQEEDFFDTLITRARWVDGSGRGLEHVPFMLTTNPSGLGVGWHLDRFVKPFDPATGTGRTPPGYREIQGRQVFYAGHNFIETYVWDNPAQSRDYVASLDRLPPAKRAVFFMGRWDSFEKRFFKLESKVHTYPAHVKIQREWPKYLAVDYGYNHTGAAYAMAYNPTDDTWYVYAGFEERELEPDEFKKRMSEVFIDEYFDKKTGEVTRTPTQFVQMFCDPSMFPAKGSSRSGTKTPVEVFNRLDQYGQYFFYPANNARVPGWQAVANLLYCEFEEIVDPMTFRRDIRVIKMPRLRFNVNLAYLWQSFTLLERDDRNTDDCIKTKGAYGPGRGDDGPDTIRYLVMGAVEKEFRDIYPEEGESGRAKIIKNSLKKKSMWA